MKFFCGVGSRETPQFIQELFTWIAQELTNSGYILRSGGAPGADMAFEKGASKKQIWLPWLGFNGNDSSYVYSKELTIDIVQLVINKQHWDRLSEAGKKLHCRNVHQVLGNLIDEPISDFVICWTKNAEIVGGTATAIKLANKFDIPVFNFGKCKDHEDLLTYWDQITMWIGLNDN